MEPPLRVQGFKLSQLELLDSGASDALMNKVHGVVRNFAKRYVSPLASVLDDVLGQVDLGEAGSQGARDYLLSCKVLAWVIEESEHVERSGDDGVVAFLFELFHPERLFLVIFVVFCIFLFFCIFLSFLFVCLVLISCGVLFLRFLFRCFRVLCFLWVILRVTCWLYFVFHHVCLLFVFFLVLFSILLCELFRFVLAFLYPLVILVVGGLVVFFQCFGGKVSSSLFGALRDCSGFVVRLSKGLLIICLIEVSAW